MNLYDFTVLDINKQPVSLSEYKDKGRRSGSQDGQVREPQPRRRSQTA